MSRVPRGPGSQPKLPSAPARAPNRQAPKVSNKTVFILLGAAGGLAFFCLLGLVLYAAIALTGKSERTTRPQAKMVGKQPSGDEPGELKPDQVVNAFFIELSKEQFEDAYKVRTSVSFQGQMSQQEFNRLFERHKGFIGSLPRQISKTQKQGRIYEYRIHVGGGPWGGADCTLEVGEEDQGWRIRRFVVDSK